MLQINGSTSFFLLESITFRLDKGHIDFCRRQRLGTSRVTLSCKKWIGCNIDFRRRQRLGTNRVYFMFCMLTQNLLKYTMIGTKYHNFKS
ncbi:MAG: hypothetical protein K0R55_473 [Sporomusa sp.]|nr:hypothetical protein [Sporomusa sp.]